MVSKSAQGNKMHPCRVASSQTTCNIFLMQLVFSSKIRVRNTLRERISRQFTSSVPRRHVKMYTRGRLPPLKLFEKRSARTVPLKNRARVTGKGRPRCHWQNIYKLLIDVPSLFLIVSEFSLQFSFVKRAKGSTQRSQKSQ